MPVCVELSVVTKEAKPAIATGDTKPGFIKTSNYLMEVAARLNTLSIKLVKVSSSSRLEAEGALIAGDCAGRLRLRTPTDLIYSVLSAYVTGALREILAA